MRVNYSAQEIITSILFQPDSAKAFPQLCLNPVPWTGVTAALSFFRITLAADRMAIACRILQLYPWSPCQMKDYCAHVINVIGIGLSLT